MTFRESGDLDTSGVSGGGGGGRRGMAIGGGVGGIVVVLVALFLGVDPGQLGLDTGGGQGQQSDSAQQIQAHIDQCDLQKANSDTICRIVATTESLEDVWNTQLPQQANMRWEQPHTNIFSGSINTGCGAASSDVGPFYCPSDNNVYLDPTFFDDVLVRRLGGSDAPAAQMYVVAHEFGHHLQTMLGDIRRSQQDPQGASSGAVRVELQADCFACAWVGHIAQGEDALIEPPTEDQVRSALSAAAAVGDDSIQERMQGQVTPHTWTHGSSEQRMGWFMKGYQSGDPNQCDVLNQGPDAY